MGGAIAALGVASAAPAQARPCATGRSDTLAQSSRAQWSPPLDRSVTVRTSDLSLRDALDRVAATANLRLSYSAELLPLDRAVCVAANAAPVGAVLIDLLRATNLVAVGAGGDQVVLTPRDRTADRDSTSELSRTVGVLDRVVVTGSAAGAAQRESALSIDVLDGHALAHDNTNTLSGALDAFVPGVWSWPQSPASMLGSYASIRGASSFGLSYPKIYIDGIEVANPLLVTRFNAGAVDRIEVIRGPQGSALYGTDAISGVINIVTRHEGTNGEGTRASVRTTAGISQSAFTHNVLAQDHAVSLMTGSSTRSADLHVSAGSIGAFIPDGYSRNLMATGSARIVGSRATIATTGRFFIERAGTPNNPLIAIPTPTSNDAGAETNTVTDSVQSVHEYTVGVSATLSPSERWTHTLIAGLDGYRLSNVESTFTPIRSPTDSALQAAEGGADRATLRASSVLHLTTTESARATLTFSAEHATLRETSPSRLSLVQGAHGLPPRADPRGGVRWQNSTGVTTQGNLAYDNRFFVTGGLRVEHDSRLTSPNQLVALPMFGAAAVGEHGPFTLKLRGAYGKGIRSPSTLGHSTFWQTSATFPSEQSLGPESQSGTEAGFDLLIRRALSMQITRFDQHVTGLVQQVAIGADSSSQYRQMTYALENVGEIANSGWELGATANVSRLAVTGALSFVDSRVTKLASGYTGDLRTGDRMLEVPARTGSLRFSWLDEHWFATLGASRAFDWINYDELALTQAVIASNRPREQPGAQLRQYWRRYNGGLHVRAAVSREIREMVSVELSAENLLNYQRGEPDNITVFPGRTIMSGVRLKF